MSDYIATGGKGTRDDDDEDDAFIKWRGTHTPDSTSNSGSMNMLLTCRSNYIYLVIHVSCYMIHVWAAQLIINYNGTIYIRKRTDMHVLLTFTPSILFNLLYFKALLYVMILIDKLFPTNDCKSLCIWSTVGKYDMHKSMCSATQGDLTVCTLKYFMPA